MILMTRGRNHKIKDTGKYEMQEKVKIQESMFESFK